MYEETCRLSLIPTEVVMKRLIQKLMSKDPADIFAEPVSSEDVSVCGCGIGRGTRRGNSLLIIL